MSAFGHFQWRRTMENLLAQMFHRGRSQYWVWHAHGHKRLSIPFRVPPAPRAARVPRAFGIGMVGHHLGKTSLAPLLSFIRKRSGIGGAFLGFLRILANPQGNVEQRQIPTGRQRALPASSGFPFLLQLEKTVLVREALFFSPQRPARATISTNTIRTVDTQVMYLTQK